MKTTNFNESSAPVFPSSSNIRHHYQILRHVRPIYNCSKAGRALLSLLTHVNKSDSSQDWTCYPGEKSLAEMANCGVRSFYTYLQTFIGLNLVKVISRGHTSNLYYFNIDAIMNPTDHVRFTLGNIEPETDELVAAIEAARISWEKGIANARNKVTGKGTRTTTKPAKVYPQGQQTVADHTPPKQGAEVSNELPTISKVTQDQDQTQDQEQRGRGAPQRPALSKNSLANDQGKPATSHQPTPYNGPSRRAIEMRILWGREKITRLTKLITTGAGSELTQARADLHREQAELELAYLTAERLGYTELAPSAGELVGSQQAQRQAGAAMPATQ
ncbi:hypothetical protein ACEUCJ_15335 [Aeromonas rivipollensis]|uniref:hypothetical protein n=1 Tax=Aeromonas rivipollensis TaxID=948519 RepID=UPI0038CFB734